MYIEEIDKALNDVAASIRSDLINSLNTSGKVATGQTEKQITVTRSANSVSLNLPAYITMLEPAEGQQAKTPFRPIRRLFNALSSGARQKASPIRQRGP